MGALSLAQSLDARLLQMERGYDAVPFFLHNSATFLSGSNAIREITMQIPSGVLFKPDMLNLYLAARYVTPGAEPPISEGTFRPADWLAVNDVQGRLINCVINASCMFDVRDSLGHAWQNAPIAVQSTFSARKGVAVWASSGSDGTAPRGVPITAYLSGKPVHGSYLIPSGGSVTVRVLPVYSEGTNIEFRVTPVLTGMRIVVRDS